MIRNIYVTADFDALHSWPKAPEEVSFLRSPHRHKFNVKLTVAVGHSDRQVEFFMLQRDLSQIIVDSYQEEDLLHPTHGVVIDIGSRSCEMIAEEIIAQAIKLGYKVISCEVSEDGENGAIVSPVIVTENNDTSITTTTI